MECFKKEALSALAGLFKTVSRINCKIWIQLVNLKKANQLDALQNIAKIIRHDIFEQKNKQPGMNFLE